MLKIVKRKMPLEAEGTINRLSSELETEKTRRTELEDAVLELGGLFAEQDDAIVELAELIGG